MGEGGGGHGRTRQYHSNKETREPELFEGAKTKWTTAVVAAETRGPDLQKETVCITTEGKP